MTSPKPPLISLSVVSHGNASQVSRLLETLQRYEQPKHFQLILTDNLGGDLPDLDAGAWADLKIVRNRHPLGFAQNHNRALTLAEGNFCCVLNPDVVFIEPVFEALISALNAQAADIIAPFAVDSYLEPQDTFRPLPTPSSLILRQIRSRKCATALSQQGLIYPDWIAGTFLLMPTRIFQLLGGFDERYWLYFEDVDLCTRARLQGLRPAVYTSLSIQHDAQRSSHVKLKYLFWHLQSAARFFSSKTYKEVKRARERG